MFNEREEEELGGGLEEWHHVVLQRSRGISERVLLSFKPGRKPIKTKAKKQMHLKWEQLGKQQAARPGRNGSGDVLACTSPGHSRVKGARLPREVAQAAVLRRGTPSNSSSLKSKELQMAVERAGGEEQWEEQAQHWEAVV